ncbi:hypothetical protein [Flaviflexus ciconiae]|uniref:hypothetical protein n=1 Tax=Flaviflexus ciconiae TaxID=2496867 RepID=UPI0013DF5984|nr:hypothetical protein [Flaviflexus ciconiae]
MSDFQIPCPKCGRNTGVKLEDVAKQRTVSCPAGHLFELVDDGGGAKDVVDLLKKFGR